MNNAVSGAKYGVLGPAYAAMAGAKRGMSMLSGDDESGVGSDVKKSQDDASIKGAVKSAKALGITVVQLAPGTELTIIDGNSRRRVTTGGTSG